MRGYFGAFLPALLVSVCVVILDVAIPNLPNWFGAIAVVPLVGYHLGYLRPRGATLSSAEVDSVYYFGFLVTVAALAATALEIANLQNDDIKPVLYKFGAGLVATGYAVIARLHLQNLARVGTVANPEQLLDSYLSRSGVLLDNLEAAIVRVRSLAEAAASETLRLTEDSSRRMEKAALASARAFEAEMTKALGAVSETVSALKSQIADTSFQAEREAFARVLRSSIAASEELKGALADLSGNMRSGVAVFEGSHSAMQSLGTTAQTLSAALAGLAGEQGVIVNIARNSQVASEASRRAAESAQQAATGVADLSSKVLASGAALSAVGESANGARAQLAGLTAACLRVDGAVDKLAKAVLASEQLGRTLERVGHELPRMVPDVQALGRELNGLKAALETTAQSLESDVQRSTRSVGLLAENLTEVAQIIIDRTNERPARV